MGKTDKNWKKWTKHDKKFDKTGKERNVKQWKERKIKGRKIKERKVVSNSAFFSVLSQKSIRNLAKEDTDKTGIDTLF